MSKNSRELMNSRHRHLLQCHHSFLIDELTAKYLNDDMFAASIFDQDDLDEIDSKPTRRAAVVKFLDVLKRSGPEAYSVFLKVLKKDYNHVAEKLESDSKLPERKPQRGKPKDKHSRVLQLHHVYLLEEVRARDIVDGMFEEGVFDEDDVKVITREEEYGGRKSAMTEFLKVLTNRGQQAYPVFIKCLKEAKFSTTAAFLERAEAALDE